MDERLKQRLVGAAVLVSLAVIFVPMVLDGASEPESRFIVGDIPDAPDPDAAYPVMPLDDSESASGGGLRDTDTNAASAAREPTPSEAAEAKSRTVAPGEAQREALATDTPAVNAWAVQLGSFAQSRNAIALRDRLRAKGYTAFLESGQTDEGTITRVYVGPELRRAQAEQALKELRGEVDLDGIVVRYPGG